MVTSRYSRRSRMAARKGIAMLMVLMAVGVATILAMGFLASQSTAMGVGRNLEYQDRARDIAETGLQLAIAKVKADSSWRSNLPNGIWTQNTSYAGGQFTVRGDDGAYNYTTNEVEGDGNLNDDPTDSCTITSVGKYGGVSHTVRALITTTPANTPTVLMVVPNAGSLSAADTTRKSMLEGWGWTVTLLSQNASQSELDDASDDVDIIYVSSTMNSNAMANKLEPSGLGMVIETGAFLQNFGLASRSASALNVTQIKITNDSHYITQTLNAGTFTIVNSSQSMQMVTGTMAAGLTQLARRVFGGSQPMLSILEAGAILQDGGTAQGRRVFMPWGTSSFDPDSLTANGRTLLQRSLDWAAGCDQSGDVSNARIGLSSSILLQGAAKIDSFDSDLGAYSAANQGSNALVSTNTTLLAGLTLTNNTIIKGDAQVGPGGLVSVVISLLESGTITGSKTVLDSSVLIPRATTPSGLGSSLGNQTYSSGTTTISTSRRVRTFTMSNSAVVRISGNVVIRVDREFTMSNNSKIQLLPGASLVIYARNKFTVEDAAEINVNTAQPASCVIYAIGSQPTEFKDDSEVYATLIAPSRNTKLSGNAHVNGSILGYTLTMLENSIFSMDATTVSIPSATGATSYAVTTSWVEDP
ncbi:MAG: hypothetical protein IT444_09245 [Phycisphaeraceae bacterium]|nr:hypothetical protein [Phycisphaeraceae bacterium]